MALAATARRTSVALGMIGAVWSGEDMMFVLPVGSSPCWGARQTREGSAAGRHFDRLGPQSDRVVDLGRVHHECGDHPNDVVVGPAGEQQETAVGCRPLCS